MLFNTNRCAQLLLLLCDTMSSTLTTLRCFFDVMSATYNFYLFFSPGATVEVPFFVSFSSRATMLRLSGAVARAGGGHVSRPLALRHLHRTRTAVAPLDSRKSSGHVVLCRSASTDAHEHGARKAKRDKEAVMTSLSTSSQLTI